MLLEFAELGFELDDLGIVARLARRLNRGLGLLDLRVFPGPADEAVVAEPAAHADEHGDDDQPFETVLAGRAGDEVGAADAGGVDGRGGGGGGGGCELRRDRFRRYGLGRYLGHPGSF